MKRGRPKEKPRKKVLLTILPSTHRTIRSSIIRGDKHRNTAGKVVDEAMNKKGKA